MNAMRKKALLPAAGLLITLFASVAAAAPLDLVFVFDNSGSMRKADPGFAARDEARRFLSGVDADTRAAVIVFDREVKLTAPLGGDAAARAKSLDGVDYRGQLTNSPAAVERAVYELKTNGREGARKAIVFMTDGIVDTGDKAQDTARSTWLRQDVAADAAEHRIQIYGIAFTDAADLLLIQSLATKTGADYFRANTAGELPAALAKVSEALAAQAQPEAASAPAPAPVEAPPAVVTAAEPPVAEAPAAEAPAASATPEAGTAASEAAALAEFAKDSGVPVEQLQQELAGETVAPAPTAAPALGGPALSDEERASLEQLSKETGIPIEQLEQELRSAQPGQAVVSPPPAPAAGQPALSLGHIAATGAAILALLVGIFVFVRRRGAAPPPAAQTPAAAASPAAPAVPPPPGRGSLPDAWLVDINGLSNEPPRRLSAKPLMVGRIAGSDPDYLDYYVVNKATVGRRHAVIKQKDQGYWLVDQGSVNGTYVNDERVAGERQLRHGDRIKFHKFEFEFQFPDGANMTVVGLPIGEQTIVAGVDQTLAASSPAALAARPAFERTAAGPAVAAAVAAADDLFAEGPSFDAPEAGDVTAVDGDLASLEADRTAFFDGSGAQASDAADLATVALNTGGGSVVEDFDFEEPPTRQVDAGLAGTSPQADAGDFDPDASAFFEETVAPPTAGIPDDGLDILDVTVARNPALDLPAASGDEEDFATATTVMPLRPLELDAVPKAPGFDDTSRTASMGTVRLGDGDDTFEDFLLSDSVDNAPKPPDSPLPAAGDDFDLFLDATTGPHAGDAAGRDDVAIEAVNLADLPTGGDDGDFFDGDVTDQLEATGSVSGTTEIPPPGSPDDESMRTVVLSPLAADPPPDESTIVLPGSPLARKHGGEDSSAT